MRSLENPRSFLNKSPLARPIMTDIQMSVNPYKMGPILLRMISILHRLVATNPAMLKRARALLLWPISPPSLNKETCSAKAVVQALESMSCSAFLAVIGSVSGQRHGIGIGGVNNEACLHPGVTAYRPLSFGRLAASLKTRFYGSGRMRLMGLEANYWGPNLSQLTGPPGLFLLAEGS